MNEVQPGGHLKVSISGGSVVKVIAIILAFVALYLVRDVVLIFLTSVVIAAAIGPGIKWFMRWKIPRPFAVLFIYVLVALVLLALSWVFIPPLVDEVGKFAGALPEYFEFVKTSEAIPEGVVEAGSQIGGDIFSSFNLTEALSAIKSTLGGLSENFFKTATTILGGALSAILILVISFYFAVQEKGIENFMRVVTPNRLEKQVLSLWKRTQDKIGKWLQGQLLLAVIIGVLVYLGLSLLQVPYALSLAAFAAVFELIPIFGPILAAIPAAIIAFVSGGYVLGLMVIGLYLIIQQFENHLIYPLVVTKIVGIPPLLVILALLVGGKLAGFLGFILAVPLATIIVLLFDDFEREKIAQVKAREEKEKRANMPA